jgi:hypothetical protein
MIRRPIALALAAAALLSAASAQAAPAPAPQPSVSELVVEAARTVSELTVSPAVKCLAPDRMPERAGRPKVVSSYPAKDAVVRPGLLIVRVTFDQPMACYGVFTNDPRLLNPCPGLPQQIRLSLDRRTVRTVCVVDPNVQYGLWLSHEPGPDSFIGLGGLPSIPYRITFATSAQPAVRTVCDALAEDEEGARQIRQRRPLDCSKASPPAPG